MPVPFPQNAVLDNATRADEGPPPSASWGAFSGLAGLVISSNRIAVEAGEEDAGAIWGTPTAANCEIYAGDIDFSTTPLSGNITLYFRFDPDAVTGYRLTITPGDIPDAFIQLQTADGMTAILSISDQTVLDGDSFGVRVIGSTFWVYKKPSAGSWGIIGTVSDATYSDGGSIGMVFFGEMPDNPTVGYFGGGDFTPVTSTFTYTDRIIFADQETWPAFVVSDTITLTDGEPIRAVSDTLTLDDSGVSVEAEITVSDRITFSELYGVSGTGIIVPDPDPPATGGLDNKPVLRLLYGNDRRNPIKTLDISQAAPFHIALRGGGFAPGPGPEIELWSGQSIRLQGQKKIAESRDNSQLAITYDLSSTSATGLFHLQSEINRFFLDAKRYQTKFRQGHTVWIEYRWADGLNTLPTPSFGQLSHYYEVLSAKLPKWPDGLHNVGVLETGNIEGVVMNITGSPTPMGLRQVAGKAGGAVSLNDKGVLIESGSSSRLHYPVYNDILPNFAAPTGNFTITGWATPSASWAGSALIIFDYYASANERLTLTWDDGDLIITKITGGVTFTATGDGSSFVAVDTPVHFIIVQDDTTLHLYVNGPALASVAADNTLADFGLVALGCPATGSIDGIDAYLDGWRIFTTDITADQAAAIYAAELPIKQLGKSVGPPPYLWTKDSDNQVDNTSETGRNNYAILGGVGGDLEALTEIRLTGTATKYYYLGLWVQDEQIDPVDYLWYEAGTGVSDSAASSGSYREDTGATISFTRSHSSVNLNALLGHYLWLTRIKTAVTITLTAGWLFGGRPITNTPRIVSNTAFKVLSFGDVFITTEAELIVDTAGFGLNITTGADSTVLDTDFLFLLPAPFTKITQPSHASTLAVTSQVPLVVENGQATAYLRSGSPADQYEYAGGRIEAYPGKYNYLFVLRLDSDEEFSRTLTTNLAVYVTPRYLLPGGMVA